MTNSFARFFTLYPKYDWEIQYSASRDISTLLLHLQECSLRVEKFYYFQPEFKATLFVGGAIGTFSRNFNTPEEAMKELLFKIETIKGISL